MAMVHQTILILIRMMTVYLQRLLIQMETVHQTSWSRTLTTMVFRIHSKVLPIQMVMAYRTISIRTLMAMGFLIQSKQALTQPHQLIPMVTVYQTFLSRIRITMVCLIHRRQVQTLQCR